MLDCRYVVCYSVLSYVVAVSLNIGYFIYFITGGMRDEEIDIRRKRTASDKNGSA